MASVYKFNHFHLKQKKLLFFSRSLLIKALHDLF